MMSMKKYTQGIFLENTLEIREISGNFVLRFFYSPWSHFSYTSFKLKWRLDKAVANLYQNSSFVFPSLNWHEWIKIKFSAKVSLIAFKTFIFPVCPEVPPPFFFCKVFVSHFLKSQFVMLLVFILSIYH